MAHNDRGVLLVSDVSVGFEELAIDRHDLEISEQRTIDEIGAGIRACGLEVLHVTEPRDIPAHALKYRECTVLSIWAGVQSRNRRSIVPAICEGYGIRYVGADAYAAAISADKALSKAICEEFGIRTPPFLLLRDATMLPALHALEYPVVLKPLFEGGSIGITQANKADSVEEARDVAVALLRSFSQPILCEQFVPGREVSFCLAGSGRANHIEAIEVEIDGEVGYFDQYLFSMEDKRLRHRQAKHRFLNVTSEIEVGTFSKIEALYAALGKVDYMRIDGKLDQGDFSCIELSTDPGIGRASLFAHSYYTIEASYEQMILGILSTQLAKTGGESS